MAVPSRSASRLRVLLDRSLWPLVRRGELLSALVRAACVGALLRTACVGAVRVSVCVVRVAAVRLCSGRVLESQWSCGRAGAVLLRFAPVLRFHARVS